MVQSSKVVRAATWIMASSVWPREVRTCRHPPKVKQIIYFFLVQSCRGSSALQALFLRSDRGQILLNQQLNDWRWSKTEQRSADALLREFKISTGHSTVRIYRCTKGVAVFCVRNKRKSCGKTTTWFPFDSGDASIPFHSNPSVRGLLGLAASLLSGGQPS